MKNETEKGGLVAGENEFKKRYQGYEVPKTLNGFFPFFLDIYCSLYALPQKINNASNLKERQELEQEQVLTLAVRDYLYQEISKFNIITPDKYSLTIFKNCVVGDEKFPELSDRRIFFHDWYRSRYEKLIKVA